MFREDCLVGELGETGLKWFSRTSYILVDQALNVKNKLNHKEQKQ